jgi:hypothetical protein
MKKLLSWLLILLPVLWVFRQIFFGKLLTWGDAPFFYPEGLKELFSEPLTWAYHGENFGGVNQLLWLSPMMFLMGILHRFLNLSSDSLIRILFYFPSIILAAAGPYFLTRYLKLSGITRFFSVLVYLLNTYYLLLIDGGQVGVALAYGLFPLIILFGKKLIDKTGLNSFFIFLLVSSILTAVDPRVYVVAFMVLLIWQALENWRKLPILILAGVTLIPLNFYWILPAIKMNDQGFGLNVAGLQLSSLLNSLLLYAPHWPGNVFGKVIQPAFYFVFVPVLIFGNLLFRQKTKISLIFALCFLIFAFFSKGSTPPLGGWYEFLVGKLPFGFAFRDSTKFFIPLILFGGILIGETINSLQSKFKSKIFLVPAYIFLLFLIYPALSGKLNFNLSNRMAGGDFRIIYEKLKEEDSFFRTVWFPEKHPLAFETLDKPALSARDLVTERPFASVNASEDVFNFLNTPKYVDWLKVLGIKYLILSGDPRIISFTQDDLKNWKTVSDLIEKTPGLKKVEWGTNLSVYEVSETLPKFFTVEKLIAVVGPEPVSDTRYPIPAIYFEDGKFDPGILNGKSQDSIKILFNGKGKIDLTMSFLQKYFKSPKENENSQWIFYGPSQYLKAKYELLIRGLEYKDFDYGKGIAFSTQKGEKIVFKLRVPKNGDYLLAKRVGNKEKQNLSWVMEEKNLKKGVFEYEVSNKLGIEVLNVVALVPKEEFKKAEQSADVFIKHFGTIKESKLTDIAWQEADIVKEGTLKYKVKAPEKGFWLIFTENYDPLWKFRKGVQFFDSLPVYSMVNGFYIEPKWADLHLNYKGQETFRSGVWVSTIAFLSLSIIYLWLSSRRDERKNKTDFKN